MGRDQVLRGLTRALGRRAISLAVRRGAGRVLGKLLTDRAAWKAALPHIAEHFSARAVARGKKVHGVFAEKYRSLAGVQDLARQAARAPSRTVHMTRATDEVGAAVGKPVLVIEREFGHVIGQEVRAWTQRTVDLKVLRIVADWTGRPISVFPVRGFLAAAAPVAATAVLTAAVEAAYAAEAGDKERWCAGVCPSSPLDWLTPPLLDSGCAACPPPDLVERRTAGLVARLEREIGTRLDPATRANVRREVFDIWYGVGATDPE